MKSVVICVVFLAVLLGNVFAGSRFESKRKFKNEDAKIFPNPGQPSATNTSHSGRIINGSNGSIEEYPFIVHLRAIDGNLMIVCGASVITFRHTFTAAHCVYNRSAASITLYGGSTSRSSGGTVFYASKVVVHPNYTPSALDYDAAIVHVRNSFQGYKNIVPIALQNAEVAAGTWCYAVGWGYNNYETKSSPDNLQYAFFQALSPEACSAAWSVPKTIMCVQQGNGVDMCRGDSGGPLVCNGRLTGATSFGTEYCRGDYPSAFAKVMSPSIREFIRVSVGL